MKSTEVVAPVTGVVSTIYKAEGASVAKDDLLMVIESMKMEIPVEAPISGVMGEIRVSDGESVEEGGVLCLIESQT